VGVVAGLALKRGWRYIYLGSPVPGLRDWMAARPEGHVEDYVHARRRGLPLDPQLRYYASRGFDRIVSIKRDYFPHERSLDYGVLLRGTVPLSILRPVWSALALPTIQRIAHPLAPRIGPRTCAQGLGRKVALLPIRAR